MPRIATVQASHTYGVLDPLVVERRDTKFVASSLSDGRNIVLLPQGGYRDRGGTTDYGRVRRQISTYSIDAGMVTMPNGGTVSDMLAGTSTTTGAASTNRFVVVQVDFGTPRTIHFIDVTRISIGTTGAAGALYAEYWTGSAWSTFGGSPRAIDTFARSRRFAFGAPGSGGVFTSRIRIAVNASLAAGAVSIAGIGASMETTTPSDAVLWKYQPERGDPHQLIVTLGNIDVYQAGTWRASIALSLGSRLRETKYEARYDTVLVFHQTLPPQALTYMGASTEWACDQIDFENIPLVDYGGVYGNGVNEIQLVSLFDIADGQTFQLTLEGQTTIAIAKDQATPANTAAAIAAALEELNNVGPGLTVTVSGGTDPDNYYVEFTGADNEAQPWGQMIGTALDDDGYVSVSTTQQGKAGGEPIMSAERGWPACGRFMQQRLVMTGLAGMPKAILASIVGDPYDLDPETGTAAAGFSYEIDVTQSSEMRDIVVGRTILFLGDADIVYLKNTVLSAEDAPQFGVGAAPGITPDVAPVTSNNAIYYIQEGGSSLQQTTYNQLEDNVVADNASVLSAFLVRNAVGLARQRSNNRLDADLLVIVNSDGSATVLTNMRSQEVSGFAPWITDGSVFAAEVDHANQLWLITRRVNAGVSTLKLELVEPDKLLDEGVELSGASSATWSGLDRFNGRQVWAIAEGQSLGPYAVSGGTVTLPFATTAVRFGTWIAPAATDPPVQLTEETKARTARLKRVNRAEISVVDTTSLALAVNDGPAVNLPLHSNDSVETDLGPLAQGVTGRIEAEGMHGFSEHGKLTVTQLFPGRLTVRSVTKNLVV